VGCLDDAAIRRGRVDRIATHADAWNHADGGVMTSVARYALGIALLSAATLRADGGTLLFAKRCEGYRVALFASPPAPRAGVVDFSVLVQALDADAPLRDVPVAVHAHPAGNPARHVGG